MAKPPVFSKIASEQQLFMGLQALSAQEVSAGTTLKDSDFSKDLQASIITAMKAPGVGAKTTPKLVPIDPSTGNPIDLRELYNRLKNYADDIESLLKQVAYTISDKGIPWNTITKIQTAAISNEGYYSVLKSSMKPDRILTVADYGAEASPEAYIASAKKLVIAALGVDLPFANYNAAGINYGVDFIIKGLPQGTNNSRVFVALKANVDFVNQNVSDESLITWLGAEVAGLEDNSAKAASVLQLEHTFADATMAAESYYRNGRKFKDKVTAFIQAAGKENDPVMKRVVANIDMALAAMLETLEATKLATRAIGEDYPEALTGGLNISEEAIEFYRSLVKQGQTLGFHVLYRDKITNKLQAREVSVSIVLEAELGKGNLFFAGRAKVNGIKGNVEKAFKNLLPTLWFKRRSPSILSSLVMSNVNYVLGESIESKKKYIKKNSASKDILYIPLYKKKNISVPKKIKLQKKVTNARKTKPIRYASVNRKKAKTQSSLDEFNLLAIINSNLREAVIDQMVYPSLVNRTGRFASSVRATGLSENQQSLLIDFVYARSPYSVFSRTGGKSPWNSHYERDPAYIVSRAIEQIRRNHSIALNKKLILKEGV